MINFSYRINLFSCSLRCFAGVISRPRAGTHKKKLVRAIYTVEAVLQAHPQHFFKVQENWWFSNAPINVTPHPPLYGDRWGIGGDLTHRMCQIPHPSITIQCQIPTLYTRTRICAGTRANACAGQKPHPWGVISWRIPYQAPPLSPTGGGGA